jgi:hypothetical protein
MKNLAFLLLMIPVLVLGQSQSLQVSEETGKYQSQSTEMFEGIQKNELYSKVKTWIALNYKSADDVVQLDDPNNDLIICKGNFPTSLFGKKGWIGHTLTFDFKDGKIRVTYTDFDYYSYGSGRVRFESNSMGFKKKIFAETEANISSSIQSIHKQISKKKDDW